MNKIEAKKLRKVNGKTLIVAVDIGKATNTGYGRCPNRTEIRPFEFSNNRQGFEQFWQRIVEAREAQHLEEIVVGFESTGLMENLCNIFC